MEYLWIIITFLYLCAGLATAKLEHVSHACETHKGAMDWNTWVFLAWPFFLVGLMVKR